MKDLQQVITDCDPCRIPEWIYATQSIHPRMYGRCEVCGTRYIVFLPRRGGVEVWGEPESESWSEQWEDAIVLHATENVLMESGNSQRLWWLLHERPLAIPQMVLAGIRHEMVERLRSREHQLDRLIEEMRQRTFALDRERHRLSLRGARGAAIKALEAVKNFRKRIVREGAEAKGIKASLALVRRELSEARAAARREPLPKPKGYVAPPIAPGSVLCGTLVPPEVVYALVDPADPELVRYVGRACDPVSRYRSHCTGGSTEVLRWVRSVVEQGRSPAMVLIERCEANNIEARESYWIHYYRERFQADLNRTIPRRAPEVRAPSAAGPET